MDWDTGTNCQILTIIKRDVGNGVTGSAEVARGSIGKFRNEQKTRNHAAIALAMALGKLGEATTAFGEAGEATEASGKAITTFRTISERHGIEFLGNIECSTILEVCPNRIQFVTIGFSPSQCSGPQR